LKGIEDKIERAAISGSRASTPTGPMMRYMSIHEFEIQKPGRRDVIPHPHGKDNLDFRGVRDIDRLALHTGGIRRDEIDD